METKYTDYLPRLSANGFHLVESLSCDCAENLMVIMEYTPHGDLLGFMRRSRGMHDRHHIGERLHVRELTNYDLVKFAQEIACGMQFLKSKGVNTMICFGIIDLISIISVGVTK